MIDSCLLPCQKSEARTNQTQKIIPWYPSLAYLTFLSCVLLCHIKINLSTLI